MVATAKAGAGRLAMARVIGRQKNIRVFAGRPRRQEARRELKRIITTETDSPVPSPEPRFRSRKQLLPPSFCLLRRHTSTFEEFCADFCNPGFVISSFQSDGKTMKAAGRT